MKNSRLIYIYIFAFAVSVSLAYLFLVFSAFLPQKPIENHIQKDIETLHEEGMYSLIGDRMANSILPMSTEMIMLIESIETNDSDLSSVLTNPYYVPSDINDDYINVLDDLINDENDNFRVDYVHYWMGYRAIMRPLLVVFGYYEIRRLVAVVFWAMLALVAYSLGKNVSGRVSMAFVFSMILVKPHVICVSPNFACCFLIAFAAMLLMPRLNKMKFPKSLIFFELGIITMYFDFYTTPIITLGFPLIYLYFLRERDGEHLGWKTIITYLAAWVVGYISMWLAKLILTTVFTDVNAFASAGNATGTWLRFNGNSVIAPIGTLLSNLRTIAYGFYMYGKWLLLILIGIAVFAIAYLIAVKKGNVSVELLKKNSILIFVAMFSLIWFLIASKPAAAHYAFQYRTIALLFFGLGAYFSNAIVEKKA